MVAKGLVPRLVGKNALSIHLHEGLLKANDPVTGKVNARIIEAIADRDLRNGQTAIWWSESKTTYEGTAVLNRTDLGDVVGGFDC